MDQPNPSHSRSAAVPATLHGDGRFVRQRRNFQAAYLRPPAQGQLRDRARAALDLLQPCRACPRRCHVQRLAGEIGFCQTGRRAIVSSAFPHHGEEDCLRGRHGSGTIFFSQCNLRCVFCQNAEISQLGEGREVSAHALAHLMLRLQETGCHNLNFVTPSHVVPQILEALALAVDAGLRLPLVYNSSGYDSLETLRLLNGVVDIYMPDFKLWDPGASGEYLLAKDYADHARAAIREMHRQVGDLVVDEEGIALRGLVIRHLVMPGRAEDTRQIMVFLAQDLSANTFVNVMDQYRPAWKVIGNPRYAPINRSPSRREIEQALSLARDAALWRFDERWIHL